MIELAVFSLLKEIFANAWNQRRMLFGTAFFHRLLALILLWPLLGWLMRWLIVSSGESALTDEAIALFLLSPIGAGGAILIATIGLAIVGLEQSSLILQDFAFRRQKYLSIPQAILFSLRGGVTTLLLILQILIYGLAMSIPFLLSIAGTAWLLLSDHDINFYLSQRPPKFFWAIIIGVLIVGLWLMVVLPRLASWSLALPLKLLFNVSPLAAIEASRQIAWPHRWKITWLWCLWGMVHLALSSLFTLMIYGLAYYTVPYSLSWLPTLLFTLGGFFLIYTLGNLVLSLFQSISFATLCVGLCDRLAWQETGAVTNQKLGFRSSRDELLSDILKVSSRSTGSLSIIPQTKGEIQSLDSNSRWWLCIAVVLGGCAMAAGLWFVYGVRQNETIQVIAHRGAVGLAPENTLAAFERAILDGADFVELDVMETADGQVVVFHDKDYMKVAGVNTKVWEATFSELQNIDIGSHFDAKFSDQRTPLLVDALRLCKNRTRVMIELKDYGQGKRLVERVIDIVEQEQMTEQIVVMSLNIDLVRETKRARPDWTVGFLAAVTVGRLTELDVDFLAVNASIANRNFLAKAHAREKPVYVWTVNSPTAMLKYLNMGVDGIITDRPDLAVPIIKQFRELSLAERVLLDAGLRIGVVPVKLSPELSENDA